MTKATVAIAFLVMLFAASTTAAQVPPTVWRTFVEQIDVGTELDVRLRDGTRFHAILVGTEADAVLLQPRTRVAVPVQSVPYETIASIQRRQGGVGAGKAAAIGIASGAGTFVALLLILLATVAD